MKVRTALLCLALAAPVTASPAAAKLFAVTITTGPAWDEARPANEQKFFREHSANLARLRVENLSVLGGRFGDRGFLLVRAPDEAEVHTDLAS